MQYSQEQIRYHLQHLASQANHIPPAHVDYLWRLKHEHGFEPKVIYDIGACVLHWTNSAKQIWPDAEYIVFDAFEEAGFLYPPLKHHVGVLSDEDGKRVKFYQNEMQPTGNSYYKETNDYIFPASRYIEKVCRRLDSLVAEHGWALPDLVKIDVQGAELDIIRGGLNTLKHAEYLIAEMQDTNYNDGAPKADTSLPYIESLGWECIAPKFCDNGPDADYCFRRSMSPTQ